MKAMVLHPLFWTGMVIRGGMIFLLLPVNSFNWYVPFMEASVLAPGRDPWSLWLLQGGSPIAFPYGFSMWLFLAPAISLASLLGKSTVLAYTLTLLAVDFLLLRALDNLSSGKTGRLLMSYWHSPIILIATYGLGLNDVIPVLLLVFAVLSIRGSHPVWSGVWLAAAVSAKLSMLLAVPLFFMYVYNNRHQRKWLKGFTASFLGAGFLLWLPIVVSDAAGTMIFGSPEISKIFQLSIRIADDLFIYLLPVAYLSMIYGLSRIRRLNPDLFHASMGITFLIIVLMTPASPGWLIWCLPFFVLYQVRSGCAAMLLGFVFSVLYSLMAVASATFQWADGFKMEAGTGFLVFLSRNPDAHAVLYSGVVSLGFILILRIWTETVRGDEFFRLSRRPFVIGIAGDSGAGKDTLSDAMADLFGHQAVSKISGDGYHRWDRKGPMWTALTHLNPLANDLEAFSNDVLALCSGNDIRLREYDHVTGRLKKSRTIRSKDFIIASGLHALYLPMLRERYDLRIFLGIDENLRRFFKLRRDVKERGHSVANVLASLEKRGPDSERFIRPQCTHADLEFSLSAVHDIEFQENRSDEPVHLRLEVSSRIGFHELSLHRILVGICGLRVDVSIDNARMMIEGEICAREIGFAARMLCPRIFDQLDDVPRWHDGYLGLMQLITLTHMNLLLNRRLLG